MPEISQGMGWWRFFVFIGLLTIMVTGFYPGLVRGGFYHILRTGAQCVAELQTRRYLLLEGEHFKVKFRDPAQTSAAALVLQTAEEIYPSVNQIFNYQPKSKVLIIMYPTEAALARCFGWPADQSALGVYWAGTIRVLSPKAWAVTHDQAIDAPRFRREGPMAHEYTHYLIDGITAGNYPRWFTEGMAQWVESQITGQTPDAPIFTEEAAENHAAEFYSLREMEQQFDALPDQRLAYWESWMAIRYLQEAFSPEVPFDLLAGLSRGHQFSAVLRQELGTDYAHFSAAFRDWALGQGTRH